MDELIKTISEQAGIPEAQAKKAAEAAIAFLKEKLPAPLAGQIDNALENEKMMGQAEDVLKKGLGFLKK